MAFLADRNPDRTLPGARRPQVRAAIRPPSSPVQAGLRLGAILGLLAVVGLANNARAAGATVEWPVQRAETILR
jgi:hypothetical protein